MVVMISRALVAQIRTLVARDPDREVCGLLIGRMKGAPETDGVPGTPAPAIGIDALVSSPNLSTDPAQAFVIDPAVHLRAQREARAAGQSVVGFYHSHPLGHALPSDADMRGASDQPAGQIWLIATRRHLAAWRLTHDPAPGDFAPMALSISA